MRRMLAVLCALVPALLPGAASGAAPASSASADSTLRNALNRVMRFAGSQSGAYVVDLSNGRALYNRRGTTRRVPASNQKLFTTGTALLRLGVSGRLNTVVMSTGSVDAAGLHRGNLYLKGSGDPTFGTTAFIRSAYGAGATISDLANRLVSSTGLTRLEGDVIGDETYFDSFRGTPYDGYRRSPFLGGQLSGLAFNRGLTVTGNFQASPALYAAAQLRAELIRLGVGVTGTARQAATPPGSGQFAAVHSPTMSTLARFTNRPSDNLFAEQLLKVLGATFGGTGSTAAGARVVASRLSGFGVRATVIDGSGLSYRNLVSPRDMTRFLAGMRRSAVWAAFDSSLAVAGRSGTLAGRMRGSTASGRCRGKTGTLPEVSALSGYCLARNGHLLAFSFLMDRVRAGPARARQDAMAVAVARYG
jgi:D-alanyl-D-alanine carboxypeptidase/D-alanyl-D-alanine-endopeptidase (penicillin-binding protein 4)